jgi:hypothetical protein
MNFNGNSNGNSRSTTAPHSKNAALGTNSDSTYPRYRREPRRVPRQDLDRLARQHLCRELNLAVRREL